MLSRNTPLFLSISTLGNTYPLCYNESMKNTMYRVEIIYPNDDVSYSEEFETLSDACKYYNKEIDSINSDNNDDGYDYIVINQYVNDEYDYITNKTLPMYSFA